MSSRPTASTNTRARAFAKRLLAQARKSGLDVSLDQWKQAAHQLMRTRSAQTAAEIVRCQRAGYRPYVIGSIVHGPIGWRRP